MEITNRVFLSTGIALVDKQHDEYFRRLGLLMDKIRDPELKVENLRGSFDYFRCFALEHFDTEELLMRSTAYQDIEEHARMHDYFRENIERLSDEMEAGENIVRIANELKIFLSGWLEDHIKSTDLQMAEYLKGRISGETGKSIT